MPNYSIPYFLNISNPASAGAMDIYFDFSNTGTYVQNISGSASLSGIIFGSTTTFWKNSGSGFINNTYIKLQRTGSEIDFTNATYCMVYESSGNGGTLISTLETGYSDTYKSSYYKGFEFGITANNYLYFEYYSNNGPTVLTSNNPLSDKSSIFLNVASSNISFGSYDFYRNEMNSVFYPINSGYFFDPTGLYIGSSSNIQAWNYNKKFTGFIDEFLAFSPPISLTDIKYINSGFASKYIPSQPITIYINTTGITGYANVLIPYYSVVTGNSLTPTGVIIDIYGTQYTGFATGNYIGTFYSTGVSGVTGIISTGVSGIQAESVVLDTGYILGFGKTNLNILNSLNGNDLIDIYAQTGYFNTSYLNNLPGSYDYLSNHFFNTYITNNNYLDFSVYAGGLGQNSGLYFNSGDVYNNSKVLVNDYTVLENDEILLNGSYDSNTNVTIDSVQNGTFNQDYYIPNFTLTNTAIKQSGANYLLNWNPYNYHIFFNGQKLLSGKDSEIGNYANYGVTGAGTFLSKNLLLYTQQFDYTGANGWFSSNAGAVVTPNQGYSPIGTYDADRIIYSNSSQDWVQYYYTTNIGAYELSCWIKAGTDSEVGKTIQLGGGNGAGYFDSGPLTLTSDWQRFSFVNNITTTFAGYIQFSIHTFGGVTARNVLVWGAQMESGSLLTDYVKNTSTRIIDLNTGIYFKNILPFSGTSGELFALPRNFKYNITGNSNTYSNNKFMNNFSEVYMNGLRLKLGEDYIETAKNDINTGSGIFEYKSDLLYNNNNLNAL